MEKTNWITTENSSLITGYRYNIANQTLTVEFRSNKAMYVYLDVSQTVADSIHKDTAGKDIKEHIVNGGYKFRKL